jgi:predicted RNase H-like nuclease
MSPMTVVIGVDGCERGWVFVRLEGGAFASAALHGRFIDGVATAPDAAVIGVDMPIGYPPPSAQRRAADVEARAMLKRRASSVFPVPPRAVLTAPDWATANERSRALTGRGLPRQSYGLAAKILEVERVAAQDGRVREVHPEVSFQALAGRPLTASKRQWNGHAERRALLEAAGIWIPGALGEVGTVAADDILDAAAAAWSAGRIAAGEAIPLPSPPEYDDDGRPVAIWY